MFGQSANTSFGGFGAGTQSSPFSQSPFGKPITTTSFGGTAAPVFGSTNNSLFGAKPAGATTGGLFGNTAATPAFGQPATSQSSFGGFSNPNTNTGLFGNQQNANTSLFGTSNPTPAFGQGTKPAGFGFGSSAGTGLFGQTQQPTQQTAPSLFAPSNTAANTSLFGATTGFAGNNTAGGMSGTVVKFNPLTGTDTMIKNGVTQTISTRHYCITCMKEYEGKSLEELRLEDYTAGRKGQVQGTQTTGLFGSAAQPSLFSNTGVNTSTANTGFGATTTGFGGTSQPTANTGLFGKPIAGFGAAATTSSAFPFNSTTTTSNPFGANAQAKPFGAAAPTPLFGNANTSQTAATGFGTNNTSAFGSFGAVQPNQSIGLFNQNKPAFNMPASTASTGFGGFGQNTATNTSGGLFGVKPSGTTGFGTAPSFGATPAPAFGTGTGFGSTQNTGTSLFNSSFKPAGQPGFSFGATPSTSTGLGVSSGLNLGTGSLLFGQPKPGGLFSTPGTNTNFNTTGNFGLGSNFGANNNTMGSGLGTMGGGMGTNPAQQNSGANQVHQQILALVSAPFGDSPLLKNLLPASGKTEDLLKPTNATTRALNSPQYKITTNNSSPKIKARAVTNAQLSKKSLFEGLEEEDPALQEAFQPRANAKRLVLRPKPISTGDAQSLDRVATSPTVTESVRVKRDVLENANKENHQQDDIRRPADDRRSSTSWLKSSLQRPAKLPEDEFEGQPTLFRGSDNLEEGLDNTVAELRPQNKPQSLPQSPKLLAAGDSAVNSPSNIDRSILNSSNSSDTSDEQDETAAISQTEQEPNAACITLRRAGYYTIPPLDKLEEYVCGDTCVVPNFTVGRKGYGNVYFPDLIDIYGLNLDEIVHFRNKEVIIYPDDDQKPPMGQGLNRRAQVTLDRVWPHDKTLHEPITDPERLSAMNYEGKLRRVSAKHDTRFLEYRPETGSWVFKVDHFSKYGLSDSDEEDEDIPANADLKKLKAIMKPRVNAAGPVNKQLVPPVTDAKLQKKHSFLKRTSQEVQDSTLSFQSDTLNETDMALNEFYTNDQENDRSLALSPSAIFARVRGTDSHKLQLMKASFFDTDDEDIDDGTYKTQLNFLPKSSTKIISSTETMEAMEDDQMVPSGHVPTLRSNLSMQQDNSFLAKESRIMKDKKLAEVTDISHAKTSRLIQAFPPPIVKPATVVLQFSSEVLPLKESIVGKLNARCVADIGIQMGRSFRVGWGPDLTLVSLSTQKQAAIVPLHGKFSDLGSYVSGRLSNDTTSSIVQRLQIVGGGGDDVEHIETFKESIVGHLRIQLNHCILGHEGDCPVVGAGAGPATLHAHCNLAQELADSSNSDPLASYTSHVWNLSVALWGNLPDIQSESDEMKHQNVMVRREALSEWLENVIMETVLKETPEDDPSDKTILSLLSAHKLEDACKIAREAGDHCSALLMAQLGGPPSVKELIKQQLAMWQHTEVDTELSPDKLKLFMLVAGEPLICIKNGCVNVCEDLEWKQALGFHLWYVCPPTASVTDAVSLYESAFDASETESYASAPSPEYQEEDYEAEISNGKKVRDLCFHLLKLYCSGNHPLEKLLNPLTHTADPLDYRLSWLIQQVLVALGYSHLSSHVAAITHMNFAAQLETYGLWHWAIFVVLHLEDTGRRRSAVVDLLSRHVELDERSDYMKREEFLREELGIPSMWINKAKAIKAGAMKRYGEAAWYLIHGEQWNAAHELIIEHLAADAIINENLDYLNSLLSPLVPTECSSTINGWAHRGQLLWDYMLINEEIEALLAGNTDSTSIGYKLELLQPQLSLLCAKINQFPCPTAKHRLCQAEIAKRTAHLARNLVLLQSNGKNSTSRILAHLVTQLPLPEDYAQQELRHIVNLYVNEIGAR
ncbi:nuclear pore complex protein Nup98-Nup96 isoform X1 [Neodiprion pinetum]|uniref:nuclear pore complex protein Nup98-Nup96 isoform X1 n=1 Tax=Neodiprion pinetum TaxID=441929 RepID=UPI001EDD928A|nr:nuclear pore complex protein Nup98-Nup96 isoform X1 [Neodiprion pinetum]XP_046478893.1 nuclear pore complex protein Nup98-Nup96 isoform X1 [Neodiprion pinetum]XP_046478894.1 nuclear pore complex protein Nup98-Nup96 isoform X1 [Neodiprion pinetum]